MTKKQALKAFEIRAFSRHENFLRFFKNPLTKNALPKNRRLRGVFSEKACL
jgi:hypothetical protein